MKLDSDSTRKFGSTGYLVHFSNFCVSSPGTDSDFQLEAAQLPMALNRST